MPEKTLYRIQDLRRGFRRGKYNQGMHVTIEGIVANPEAGIINDVHRLDLKTKTRVYYNGSLPDGVKKGTKISVSGVYIYYGGVCSIDSINAGEILIVNRGQ